MFSHQKCKNCNQRKGMKEYTTKCPANPGFGHNWETISGNGVSWNESLVGKIWRTKFGKIFIIILVVIIYLLSSCSPKEKYHDLQKSVNEVQKNADNFTNEDWDKYDKEIEETKEQLNTDRDKYTPEEIEKMNKLIGKYYALKASDKASNLKQDLKDASQQLEGMYETIFKGSEENLKE
jgi:hypothetical protein